MQVTPKCHRILLRLHALLFLSSPTSCFLAPANLHLSEWKTCNNNNKPAPVEGACQGRRAPLVQPSLTACQYCSVVVLLLPCPLLPHPPLANFKPDFPFLQGDPDRDPPGSRPNLDPLEHPAWAAAAAFARVRLVLDELSAQAPQAHLLVLGLPPLQPGWCEGEQQQRR